VQLEAQAKMQIQYMIRNGELELATSYVLDFENSRNHSEQKRQTIKNFMREYEKYYVPEAVNDKVIKLAAPIMQTGVKKQDAVHVVCAILTGCDYFITVDDRLLKYQSDKITLLSPVEFMYKWGN